MATENSPLTAPSPAWRPATLSLALALAILTATPILGAQPSDADRTAAEALFRDGKRLMNEGDYPKACPKLAESQRRDPGGGTLLNLALCHEKQGKVATAWGQFREALGLARGEQRQGRITFAEEHIAALEPRLPKLTVVVPAAAAVDGLEVSLDGSAAVIDTVLPIDPGDHQLRASAPGKQPWTESFSVEEGEVHTLTVPALDDSVTSTPTPTPIPSPTPTPKDPMRDDGNSGGAMQVLGFVVGGLGVVAMGAGAVAGGIAMSKHSDSDNECPEERCTQAGVDLNEEAKTAALVSNIGVFGGLGLLTVGVVLVLTADSNDDAPSPTTAGPGSTWQLGPTVSSDGGGMLLMGWF